jgi:hypothetical protein
VDAAHDKSGTGEPSNNGRREFAESVQTLWKGASAAAIEIRPRPADDARERGPRRVRLIVWCKACGHRVEPDAAEMAGRYGADTAVPEWRGRLVCPGAGAATSTWWSPGPSGGIAKHPPIYKSSQLTALDPFPTFAPDFCATNRLKFLSPRYGAK